MIFLTSEVQGPHKVDDAVSKGGGTCSGKQVAAIPCRHEVLAQMPTGAPRQAARTY